MQLTVDKTAIEIIADYTHAAPVDVYGLARALGLEVKDAKLDEDVSGKIERNWFFETYTITINASHPLTRRRFTAAHEIAHFILHRDLIGDGIVDDAMYRSKKGDDIERQANSYAATILMPARLSSRNSELVRNPMPRSQRHSKCHPKSPELECMTFGLIKTAGDRDIAAMIEGKNIAAAKVSNLRHTSAASIAA